MLAFQQWFILKLTVVLKGMIFTPCQAFFRSFCFYVFLGPHKSVIFSFLVSHIQIHFQWHIGPVVFIFFFLLFHQQVMLWRHLSSICQSCASWEYNVFISCLILSGPITAEWTRWLFQRRTWWREVYTTLAVLPVKLKERATCKGRGCPHLESFILPDHHSPLFGHISNTCLECWQFCLVAGQHRLHWSLLMRPGTSQLI